MKHPKKKNKSKKKYTVVEYSSSIDDVWINERYRGAIKIWHASITFTKADNVVEVYEIKNTKKIPLKDMLDSIHEEMDTLIPKDAKNCGFKIVCKV